MSIIGIIIGIVLLFISQPINVKKILGGISATVCALFAGYILVYSGYLIFQGLLGTLLFQIKINLILFLVSVIGCVICCFSMKYAICFSKDENGKLKVAVKNVLDLENKHADEIPLESVATVINAKYGDNAENSENDIITGSIKMEYRVEEVSAGLCTGTLRGPAIEQRINMLAKQGWKFEQCETIVGRCCLIFARYKAVIIFSKPSA